METYIILGFVVNVLYDNDIRFGCGYLGCGWGVNAPENDLQVNLIHLNKFIYGPLCGALNIW